MLYYHIIAFSIGVIADFLIGDPYQIPHPIRLIGRLIGVLDNRFLGSKEVNYDANSEGELTYKDNKGERAEDKSSQEFLKGMITVMIVLLLTVLCVLLIVFGSYRINYVFGIIVEAVLTCYCLAAKSLCTESMKVYAALMTGNIEKARYAVSMIVGRDTAVLDETGVAKAAVETVAENTSDGVIAPLLYTFIGGPVLGLAYKAFNTMDSMIGYHNDRYEYFGKSAAKLDDIVNYIPARISAIMMIVAAFVCGLFSAQYSAKEALRIFKRDRYNHKSPNSAQTESVCAGALRIRLAGDASYFGKIVKKPFIGDDNISVSPDHIKDANILMFATEILLLIVLGTVTFACYKVMNI